MRFGFFVSLLSGNFFCCFFLISPDEEFSLDLPRTRIIYIIYIYIYIFKDQEFL